jgi:LPS sulfotransferase NodH
MNKLPVQIFESVRNLSGERVFLFAEARSGSSWLLETINSSPEVSLLKEIMQPIQRQEFYRVHPEDDIRKDHDVEYLERRMHELNTLKRGCKILFPQAVRFMDLYEFIFNYPDARYILLHRENLIKGEVSGFVAREFDYWHPEKSVEKHAIGITPEFLFQRVLWRDFTTRFCMELICSHTKFHFEITYESLFQEKRAVLTALCNFLGIDNNLKNAREIKANPHPLQEMILNYDQVKALFHERKAYTDMLD